MTRKLRLTKPVHESQTDERAGQKEESLVDTTTALIPNAQALETMQSTERAFNYQSTFSKAFVGNSPVLSGRQR